MIQKHLASEDLTGKTIDSHSHVGVGLKYYACLEYPYAQTVEDLYYKQRFAGVDVSVVFPASASLFFDPEYFRQGEMRPARNPLSPAPYAVENEMMMLEVFEINRGREGRYIPFVSVDPGRMVPEQIELLRDLESRYPIYGIKISPVECQSKITSLLGGGRAFLDYAAERDLPFLLHTTVDPEEQYSHAALAFEVIDRNPHLRFCLAHCIGFSRSFLDRADSMPNVWVDTAALKIQVQLARENSRVTAPVDDRFEGDYGDHTEVICALMARYPQTIIWGTDSPWHSFICRRKQGDGSYLEFRLEGRYEEEVAALDSLPPDLRTMACNTNTRQFIFGA